MYLSIKNMDALLSGRVELREGPVMLDYILIRIVMNWVSPIPPALQEICTAQIYRIQACAHLLPQVYWCTHPPTSLCLRCRLYLTYMYVHELCIIIQHLVAEAIYHHLQFYH